MVLNEIGTMCCNDKKVCFSLKFISCISVNANKTYLRIHDAFDVQT